MTIMQTPSETLFSPLPKRKDSRDLNGMIFGRLTVLGYTGAGRWLVRCDCGKEKRIHSSSLVHRGTKSCGCLHREMMKQSHTTHGESKGVNRTVEFTAWRSMLQRCFDRNQKSFSDYGGRGITVCQRWIKSYPAFLEDMGRKPTPVHTLERIDNEGNYEPSNCRWATRKEQARNMRRNRFLTKGGETMCLADWSKRVGVKEMTIIRRLSRGWSVEEALETPFEPWNPIERQTRKP